jgi:hypothetical protein
VSFYASERITPSSEKEDAGTNLDQCRSDAVDQSRNCQTIFRLASIRGIESGYTISFVALRGHELRSSVMAKRFPLGNEWLARFRFARVSAAKNDQTGEFV